MLDNVQKITRVIIQPTRNLVLKMHVKLLKENNGRIENFHNEFGFAGKNYLKLDLQSFMTLEIVDKVWDKSKSILIDQKNIYQIIKGFEKTIEGIYNGKVFALNRDGKTIIYSDMVEKNTVKIYNLGNGNRLVVKPAIIYDDSDLTYEGVVLFVNTTDNFVELPIDAFESLYFAIKQTNLFLYSQGLVNYYVSCLEKGELENNTPVTKNISAGKRKNVFDNETTEFVKSSGMTTSDDIMSDYNKEE
jgi:hypothetical protein